jgi:hypothetical protein
MIAPEQLREHERVQVAAALEQLAREIDGGHELFDVDDDDGQQRRPTELTMGYLPDNAAPR